MNNFHNIHCKSKSWYLTKDGLKKSNTFNDYKSFMYQYIKNKSKLYNIERHSFP